ncbi:MAG: PAS domain-containing protein [Anaerolineales bacterium]
MPPMIGHDHGFLPRDGDLPDPTAAPFLERILCQTDQAVLLLSPEGLLLKLSAAAEHLLGVEGNSYCGRSYRALPLTFTDATVGGDDLGTVIAGLVSGESTDSATLAVMIGGSRPGQARVDVLRDGARALVGFMVTLVRPSPSVVAEGTSQEYHALLQGIIDLLPVDVFVKDSHSRYVLVNQSAAATLGTTAEQVLGHTDAELVERDAVRSGESSNVARTDGLVLSGARRADYRFTFHDDSGRERTYLVTKRPFVYRGKRGILGVGVDITVQREAEQRIGLQQAWYQQILDLLPGDVFVRDAQGRYVLVNRQLARAFQLEEHQLIGRTDAELVTQCGLDPAWAKQFAATDHVLLSGEAASQSYVFTGPNGHGGTGYYLITKVPFALPDGSPAVLGVSVDITRQREIDMLEQQLQSVYDHVPVGIVVLDREGIIVRAKRRLAEMLRLDLKAIEGVNTLTHPATRDYPWVADVRDCLERGVEHLGEANLTTSGMGTLYLRYGLAPRRNDQGEVIGALVMIEDATAYRRLQERLLQAAQLEALGQLAGGVAHSFRNLLTIINGYTEMTLLNKHLGARTRADLAQVLSAGQRAADLSRQLLTFSRQTELELSVFDLNEMLRDMARMLAPLLSDAVTLTLSLSEQTLLVRADRAQLEQAVINLAVNARQAMPQGGTLTITTRARRFRRSGFAQYLKPAAGSYALIEITDTGTGMTSEVLQHLFEPFFTTKPEGEGTGLGLSMVYGLMQRLGGGIDVHSKPGEGSRFRLYLPRVPAKEAPRAGAVPCSHLPRAKRGELLLVADPDDASRKLLVRMLSLQLGYTVFDVATGAEAMQVCADVRERFDLVLTEVQLPDMPASAMLRQLGEQDALGNVLYVTALSSRALAARGDVSPESPILARPFTLERVANAVRAALDAAPDAAVRGLHGGAPIERIDGEENGQDTGAEE